MPKVRFYAKFALNIQKCVKFLFTYSALSAIKFIFSLLSDHRAVSVIIKRLHFWSESKGLKLKTYTMTWRHAEFYGSTLSRVRFDSLGVYWNSDLPNDKLLQFISVMNRGAFRSGAFLRLVKCGKLVARQATYQGV